MLDLIQRRARQSPDRPALFFNGRWYSYAELDRRAIRLANRLREAGVEAGDRVGILALNHLAHFDLMLAAPKLGYIHVPLNHRLSGAELARMTAQVEPRLLFADGRHLASAQTLGAPVLALEGYSDWLDGAGDEPPPEPALDEESIWTILFTGGSTGPAKGAMLPYRQLLLNARLTADAWQLDENDCAIQCTPCFHAAVNVLSLPLLHRGGRVVLMSNFDADEYLGHVGLHRATVLFMVPTTYQMLIDFEDFEEADLSSVRWAISGGAPCPEPVRQAFVERGVRFKQGYGMTEAGVNCFQIEVDEADLQPDSVGRPMPRMEMVIRSADGQPVAPGAVGELTLSGPMLFKGYWQQPEETAQALRDGWLWTGDLACADGNGLVRIVGRRKEMYISGGENVYPAEVEAALYRCEGVLECAVTALADPQWGEQGLAALVLQEGVQRDGESLRQELRAQLAAYKLPRWFYFLRALPKTGAGKVDKAELRRLYEHRGAARAG